MKRNLIILGCVMAALACSCSSTIKWDKVNIDPLTNTATFKKNGKPVTGTIAKGEKKGSYEEIVAENGNIIYKNTYLYEKLSSNVDYRTRKITTYDDNNNMTGYVIKTADNKDSLLVTCYANGTPQKKIDRVRHTIKCYYENGSLKEVDYKTASNQDSLLIAYSSTGVVTKRAVSNPETRQDTIKQYRNDGTMNLLEIRQDKAPLYSAEYFGDGKTVASETIQEDNGQSTKKKYNERGMLVELATYSGNRPLKSYEYTNGKQTKATVYDDKGNVYSVNGKRIFPVVDGVQLIAYKTGYFHAYNLGGTYIWEPTVIMKWKNVSGATIDERIEIVGTFLDGNEEWSEETVYLHSTFSDNPMSAGLVRRKTLKSSVGYKYVNALSSANIKCDIYVNDKLYTSFKISNQQLYSDGF